MRCAWTYLQIIRREHAPHTRDNSCVCSILVTSQSIAVRKCIYAHGNTHSERTRADTYIHIRIHTTCTHTHTHTLQYPNRNCYVSEHPLLWLEPHVQRIAWRHSRAKGETSGNGLTQFITRMMINERIELCSERFLWNDDAFCCVRYCVGYFDQSINQIE